MASNDEVLRAFAAGTEEAVEVNQRGLIEKILARYSGDYTVFRELLQNADDAQASVRHIHLSFIPYWLSRLQQTVSLHRPTTECADPLQLGDPFNTFDLLEE